MCLCTCLQGLNKDKTWHLFCIIFKQREAPLFPTFLFQLHHEEHHGTTKDLSRQVQERYPIVTRLDTVASPHYERDLVGKLCVPSLSSFRPILHTCCFARPGAPCSQGAARGYTGAAEPVNPFHFHFHHTHHKESPHAFFRNRNNCCPHRCCQLVEG